MFAARQLAVLDEASRMLASANSLDEIKAIRDKAEAARTYVKAAQLGLELQNRASELKIRAERKAGSFLRSLNLRGGCRRSNRHRAVLKLADLGISSDQSRRWQKIASVSESEFEQYVEWVKERHRELTSAGLLRLARKTVPRRTKDICPDAADLNWSAKDSPQEFLGELLNHFQLLADVLRPLYEVPSAELKPAEKRVIPRLIGEINTLIAQLQKNWLA
jgi:hypothetical protein